MRNALNLIERIQERDMIIDCGEKDRKQFDQNLKVLYAQLDHLTKFAEEITKGVIIFYKPNYTYGKDEDALREKIIPVEIEVERLYETLGSEKYWDFIETQAGIYLMKMISEKPSGYLNLIDGNRRLMMFREFKGGLRQYFHRFEAYRQTTAEKYLKGLVIETYSPKNKNYHYSATHYALTDKGKETIAEMELEPLALKMIEVIDLILEKKKK